MICRAALCLRSSALSRGSLCSCLTSSAGRKASGKPATAEQPGGQLSALSASTEQLSLTLGEVQLREKMPALVKAIDAAGQTVTWICDPMHGNTESCEGFKTRRYENIRSEVCFQSSRACSTPLLPTAGSSRPHAHVLDLCLAPARHSTRCTASSSSSSSRVSF